MSAIRILFLLIMICPAAVLAEDAPLNSDIIKAVSENPLRNEEDVARDAHRKPAQVLEFWGIKPDAKIVDLEAGAGYYSKILSAYLTKGHVTAINSEFLAKNEKFADRIAMMDKFAKEQANVTRREGRFDKIEFPNDLDGVLFVNFYHDTLWLDYDRKAMNDAIFKSLKSGGTYLVVDHESPHNTGFTVGKTLHRIEGAAVLREVLASGFHLIKSGNMLVREDDVLTQSAVKQDERRGKTSRFVYVFQKP